MRSATIQEINCCAATFQQISSLPTSTPLFTCKVHPMSCDAAKTKPEMRKQQQRTQRETSLVTQLTQAWAFTAAVLL